ncbi:Origin recognition complex, subunit 1 [Xylographa trunciseda]|nr:Origin recognition complex, subunit 1 [Xylographa trunciseda]
MPETIAPSKAIYAAKAKRARNFLKKGGISREDSDDELGTEDHPWQWIYSDSQKPGSRKIIGARMGDFSCVRGDCVLLKAESNEAWVGLIHDFETGEEEGEKSANFMWFSTPKEISRTRRNKQLLKSGVLANELYITPAWDVNPLTSINGKAHVMSLTAFHENYPLGKVPRSSKLYDKTFICRRGLDTTTATYTDSFVWEDMYRGAEDIEQLSEFVRTQTQAVAKKIEKRKRDTEYENSSHASNDDQRRTPKTPSKRHKLSIATTPDSKNSIRACGKYSTPTHKRIAVKKTLVFTPLGTRVISPTHIASSPFQIARTRLHVSAVPAALPCREEALEAVYSHLETAICDGSGCCIYISGTPGTGKTATVREVVAQLDRAVLAEELNDFIFVEINGMKVTDPHQSYTLLWEALHGDRVSPSHALELLERDFSNPNPRRVPCVVLMDELDQLVTKNQSVMYNFFNWPSLRHSRLIVLAVANTMDLPERTLSNKISSRLGLTRITFPGYNHEQLMKIIHSRLEGVPGNIVDPDAIQFAGRKVAAVSGDARRALDICRRAVEIAETESLVRNPLLMTPTKKAKHKELTDRNSERGLGRVTISTIKQAINEATSSPLQQSLRSLPMASKLILAALLSRVRRTGIAECKLGDVVEEAKRLGHMADNSAIRTFLLTFMPRPRNDTMPNGGSTTVPRMLALGVAAIELMEAGIVGIEQKKRERIGRIRLNVGEDEVKTALKDDSEVRGIGFLT